MHGQDQPYFLPAESYDEATARVYALAGGAPAEDSPGGSRGVRGALAVLAEALGVEEDPSWTSAMTAERAAQRLDIVWEPTYVVKTSVNLDGLNALLDAASDAYSAGSLKRVTARSAPGLDGAEWATFNPARSKIEAVTRLAALTGAPREWLGPGSKEHKSALQNLAGNLFPSDERIDTSSKHRLGATLAEVLNAPWSKDFTATGQTIKLTGLNAILAGAERHLGRLGEVVSDALTTPEAEGDALAAALLAALPVHWDAKQAVRWLAENDLRGSNDLEWQGFYGEEKAKAILNASFTPNVPGPRRAYGSTAFDYALSWVWDIKVHTSIQTIGPVNKRASDVMLLNDERAVRDCVDEQGLGFLVVSGDAVMDHNGEFKVWHDTWKAKRSGRASAPSNSGSSRVRKSAFNPLHVDAYWVPDTLALGSAILSGQLTPRAQGRQAPRVAGGVGAPRPPKFEMNTAKAGTGIRVASYTWPKGRGSR
ncbi:hypothetical protein [Nocardioides sp. P86]|uniref:hypothetical protein n=1 Tax=Nocardioides sp. P86 TaxID=2939569 RepID=UPI00203EA768|nr:hypothetical protein [Nocardioides sp. P86]MCM3515470.1 hypothetical protein [Nocardioides sp. P86]